MLAESAERRSKIDVTRAEAALERAQQRLDADDRSDIDVVRAKAAMLRAMNRLRIAKA